MDQFYKLMVKDSLDREDVENMEKEKMRSSYEIVQLFRDSNGIYHSFISESVIQLILGAIVDLVLIWVIVTSLRKYFALTEELHRYVIKIKDFYHKT